MEAAVSSDIARLQRDHDLRGRTAAMPADAVLERSARLSKDHLKHAHIRDLTGQRTTWTCGLAFRPPALGTLPVSLRANGDLLKNFRLIWVIQPPAQKYSAFLHPQISGFLRTVPSRQEGRIARRHERGTGCDGRRDISSTNDVGGGRQKCVVLISRRWDQVCQ